MSSGFGESTKSASCCSENSSNKDAADFECNICFDLARDPVVTLCGHLFCWPCLYMWLHHRSCTKGCPVCKALVEEDKLVPLYGKGRSVTNPRTKSSYLGMEIPRRPLGQRPQTVEEDEEELLEEDEDEEEPVEEEEDEEELEDPDYVDNPTLLVRLEEMCLSRDSTEQRFKEYRESTEQRFNEYTEFLNEYKEFRDEYKKLRDEYRELRVAAESRIEQIEQRIKEITECRAEEEQRIMECHAEAEQQIKECRAEAEKHIKECRAEAEQWIKESSVEAEQLIKECRAVHADAEQRFRSINN